MQRCLLQTASLSFYCLYLNPLIGCFILTIYIKFCIFFSFFLPAPLYFFPKFLQWVVKLGRVERRNSFLNSAMAEPSTRGSPFRTCDLGFWRTVFFFAFFLSLLLVPLKKRGFSVSSGRCCVEEHVGNQRESSRPYNDDDNNNKIINIMK